MLIRNKLIHLCNKSDVYKKNYRALIFMVKTRTGHKTLVEVNLVRKNYVVGQNSLEKKI